MEETLIRWDGQGSPDLKGVVVRRNGRIEAERYYNGDGASKLHDIRSAGKSVTSLLVGIAIGRGLIGAVTDPVSRYLPEAAHGGLADVTVADLLTMRSGLSADDSDRHSPGNEERMDAAADPFRFATGLPRKNAPGTRYSYNSVTAYLVGLVVERASGQPLDVFATNTLFTPLEITDWRWQRDAAGHTKGQGNLSITARDLAAIGQMVLDRGVYDNRLVVDSNWIDASLAPRVPIRDVDQYADAYGYMWYTRAHNIAGETVTVSFASGNGGNKIYVVPSRSLVVAITSSAYGLSHGQRRSEQVLLQLLEHAPA